MARVTLRTKAATPKPSATKTVRPPVPAVAKARRVPLVKASPATAATHASAPPKRSAVASPPMPARKPVPPPGLRKVASAVPATVRKSPPGAPKAPAAASARQAPPPLAIRAARFVEKGYAGLGDFRNIGGALIEQVATVGKTLKVGTSSDTILLVLRPASKFPKEVRSVPAEFRFRYDKAKENILQVRTIVAMGGHAVFISRSGKEVLVHRHSGFEHDIIDKFLDGERREAEEAAIGSLTDKIDALFGIIVELKAQRTTVSAEGGVAKKALEKTRDLDERLTKIDAAIRPLVFKRGADAAVADATKPRRNDLEGHYEN